MTTLPASEETVMPATDMPERIYARKCGGNCVIGFSTPSLDYNIEYVRADLVQATREQAVRECAEIAREIATDVRNGSEARFQAGVLATRILSLSQVSAKK